MIGKVIYYIKKRLSVDLFNYVIVISIVLVSLHIKQQFANIQTLEKTIEGTRHFRHQIFIPRALN